MQRTNTETHFGGGFLGAVLAVALAAAMVLDCNQIARAEELLQEPILEDSEVVTEVEVLAEVETETAPLTAGAGEILTPSTALTETPTPEEISELLETAAEEIVEEWENAEVDAELAALESANEAEKAEAVAEEPEVVYYAPLGAEVYARSIPLLEAENLWTLEDARVTALMLHGETRGLSEGKLEHAEAMLQKSAVVWVPLNRADANGTSIAEEVTKSNAFYLASSFTPEDLEIVLDVFSRWSAEKMGAEYVGRVLPMQYIYFGGNGKRNRFRDAYNWKNANYWDWSLPNPYV